MSTKRFKLGKGITRDNGQGVWRKEYIELEVELPEKSTDKDFSDAFTATEATIDQLLTPPETAAPKTSPGPKQPIITMTPQEVDALPWTASSWVRKEDQDRKARLGEDAWIREDEVKDPRLLKMLEEGKGKFELPGVYTFEHKVRPGYETGLVARHSPKKERSRD